MPVTSSAILRSGVLARASWTASGDDLSPHVEAFSRVLANVAGLPPEGVAQLGR